MDLGGRRHRHFLAKFGERMNVVDLSSPRIHKMESTVGCSFGLGEPAGIKSNRRLAFRATSPAQDNQSCRVLTGPRGKAYQSRMLH
jgi:hypothetical protein